MMKKRRQTVWVVMHYEYRRFEGVMEVGCLLSHVSSTQKGAEAFICRCSVPSYSWWQLYPKVVDCDDLLIERHEIYYYSHRGTLLQSLPFKRAELAFKRAEENNQE